MSETGDGAMRAGHFDFQPQERVVWGRPAAEAIAVEAERLGARRIFICSSRSLSQTTDAVARIRSRLGSGCVGLFDACREHTPREAVIKATKAAREAAPDAIVAIGGGSVIDTVKLVVLCLTHDIERAEQLDAYYARPSPEGLRPNRPIGPIDIRQIAVPTTLSGAEFSHIGGCTDPVRQVKDYFIHPRLTPVVVIYDPMLARATPERLWLSTGIRALDHAVESICSVQPTAITDGCALQAVRLLSRALPRCKSDPDDIDARMLCLEAAWLAAFGIARVPYGASHGIGHSLGAITGMSHGITSCIMLPAVLAWNRSQGMERQGWIAEALGRSDGDAGAAVAALVRSLGLPGSLREAGVALESLDKIAEAAVGTLYVRTNPRPISGPKDVRQILAQAW